MKPDPFIRPLERDELPEAMRCSHDRAVSIRGDGTFIGVMGHAPDVLDWYGDFYRRVFYGGAVPVAIKELVRFRLSTLHGCAFCNRGNRLDALAAGLTELQLSAIDDPGAACWSGAERAALRLAGEMSLGNPGGVLSAELYADLRQHFPDAQIVELGVTMAVLTGMAKFIFTFDMVERESYCEFGR
jgi:AhpD family alkylhydroperoxidase